MFKFIDYVCVISFFVAILLLFYCLFKVKYIFIALISSLMITRGIIILVYKYVQ